MKIIKTYLQKINEGRDYKDPSLPNPYDYQSISLDPKVTTSDMKKAIEVVEKNRDNYIDVDGMLKDMADIIKGKLKYDPKFVKSFTIVDKGKRVGYVEISRRIGTGWNDCMSVMIDFIVWVNGNKYATRAAMKLSSLSFIKNQDKFLYMFETMKTNKAMIKSIKHLMSGPKDECGKNVRMVCYVVKPFWWE